MKGLLNTAALVSMISCLGLTGCTDDLNLNEGPNETGNEIDGDCIAFTVELRKDLSTRDGGTEDFSTVNSKIEAYENYIDTQDKFRIFFFSEDGDFLFGANDRTTSSLIRIQETSSSDVNYWYVRIPMTMLVDRDNEEYDIDKIKDYLKNHDFKVAVLANWPNGGEKVNPADWDDAEGSGNAVENPSSILKGNPRWNWSNSILNIKAKSEDIRNINDLHHVYNDLYYGAPSRSAVYQDFMAYVTSGDDAGYHMGEPTDWVKMRDVKEGWQKPDGKAMVDVNGNGGFTSKTEANRWIRANCTPNTEINQAKNIYRHYQHMWFLWNFNAAFKTGSMANNVKYYATDEKTEVGADDANKYVDRKGNYKVASVGDASFYEDNWNWNDESTYTSIENNPFGAEWYKRNGDILYQWMKKSYNDGDNFNQIGKIEIQVGEANNDVFFKYVPTTGGYAYCKKVGDNYGIQLPNIGDKVQTTEQGMMVFQARTAGTLRIKFGSLREGTASGIGVQVGGALSSSAYYPYKDVSSETPVDWKNTRDNNNYLDISVEGNSMPVYIFGIQGEPVVYAVEFIRGRYLYETDREGVAPSEQQGIPMYGVKTFNKIQDWQRGTTFNLPGNVSLIRALAKVELYIKDYSATAGTDANNGDFSAAPRHVYMRYANRAARCEPMDVETDTENLWTKDHSIFSEDALDARCEWFNIQKYGPFYKGPTSYKDWLSWFYGSWTDTRWKATGGYAWNFNLGYQAPLNGRTGWVKNTASVDSKYPSPRIFNPYYYRSDFCRFLTVGKTSSTDGGNYYKYVLYLPDKNIDDPTNLTNQGSVPKVPHIEYRFAPKDYSTNYENQDIAAVDDDPFSNTEYNLDDNDCYRLYFTNYGTSSNQTSDGTLLGTEVNKYLKSGNWNSTNYDEYEQDRTRLTTHWPIMRNHRYQFFIGGDKPENPEIHVRVSDWSHGKVVLEW